MTDTHQGAVGDARKRLTTAQTPATAPNSPDAGTESHPCHSGPQAANHVVARTPLDPDAIDAIRGRAEFWASRDPENTQRGLYDRHAVAFAREVVALLAALDEVEKERDDLAQRLSELLWNLTGGLLSKTGYSVRDMAQAIESEFEKNLQADLAEAEAAYRARDAATARADALAAKVERVEVLADEWVTATCLDDGAPCTFHRQAPGYASDLRAALADPAGDPS